MDKYLIRTQQDLIPEVPNLHSFRRWKRTVTELSGRLDPKYRRQLSSLLIQSYNQVGAFPHVYQDEFGFPCKSYATPRGFERTLRQGIASLAFDNKGVYLVSVTKSGCLTVHDVEALYSAIDRNLATHTEEKCPPVLHLSLGVQLDSVCWNPLNQDEVACISMKSNEVNIFDIGYVSSEPTEVLRSRRDVSVHGSEIQKGLTDVMIDPTDKFRLFAPDTNGTVNLWDRRIGNVPVLNMTSNSRNILNSIKLNVDVQVVFGSGRNGTIHAWDLRGGKSSSAFHNHKQASIFPISSFKVATMLERIRSLKEQAAISPREVHAIDFNPSCPYQLAFHLDDGWSGALDIFKSEVTHVHCPPPAWLNGADVSAAPLCLRKPSWLLTHSCYVVGSACDNGIHFLDFHPGPSSPCHVDFGESREHSRTANQSTRNRFLPLTEAVTVCATHPLTETIMAGTKNSSLVMVSQPK